MRYLLDTDIVIDHLTGHEPTEAILAQLLPQGAAISILTFSEIYEGIYGSRDPAAAERGFQEFLEGMDVLGIDEAIGQRNARIRWELRTLRRPVTTRALDLLIAATALEYDLTLVTRNLDDYQDIPGLRLYQRP